MLRYILFRVLWEPKQVKSLYLNISMYHLRTKLGMCWYIDILKCGKKFTTNFPAKMMEIHFRWVVFSWTYKLYIWIKLMLGIPTCTSFVLQLVMFLIHEADPQSRPPGSDHYFLTCCMYVRPHFSKSLKTKQSSRENSDCYWWVWPSGSLMTHMSCFFSYFSLPHLCMFTQLFCWTQLFLSALSICVWCTYLLGLEGCISC